ncbi:feline leukemia virus subgroup C receptor-related protein 2-like isoform X3 [Thrips palmi]|uniref:Feline leukemia virus subgroup C receptor-related protein 2-like isoform X3 n=1 Tax=Thrips palmi TaxID=161013 RepID=A0A6P8Z4K3_THRPL|nr:feline leukemia virus subgroup C receptor-related protein 2-like isoform X3 [Thrips palmi]
MSLSSGGDVEGGVNGKKSENGAPTLKVFRRRWLVLAAFCFLSLLNGFQWVQYAIVSDSVARYYGVSLQAVDWASMVYMLMYVPFVAPASWMLDKKGLRHTVVLAAVLNCLAAWVKVASGRPDLYAVTMVGQAVAAVTQAFVLAVPARLAAVWFGAGEVATACAIGVFGNQVGNAFGFLLPPLVVKNQEDVDELGSELRTVYYGVAAATTLSLLIILLVFQDAPPVPPSHSQALSQGSTASSGLLQSIGRLLRTPGFALLVVTYGISVGAFYAISTVLNLLVNTVFPGNSDAGNIGLVLVVAGLLGSIVCGVLLDATRKYKEVTLGVYVLSVAGMIAFMASFLATSIWVVYLTSFFLGFFLTGYLPLGFELAVELTYPEPEGTSAGLLNVSAQVFGIVFTELCGLPLERQSGAEPAAHLWVNGSLSGALLLGALLTALIPRTLRRQTAQAAQASVK